MDVLLGLVLALVEFPGVGIVRPLCRHLPWMVLLGLVLVLVEFSGSGTLRHLCILLVLALEFPGCDTLRHLCILLDGTLGLVLALVEFPSNNGAKGRIHLRTGKDDRPLEAKAQCTECS